VLKLESDVCPTSSLNTLYLIYITADYFLQSIGFTILPDSYYWLVGNHKGNRPLGKPIERWENIKMVLRKTGMDVDWTNLAQNRLL
jgi:hypothetical protein